MEVHAGVFRGGRNTGGLLGDSTASDAGGADHKRLVGSIHQSLDPAQIGLPAAGSYIMGVTDSIAVNGLFAADFARTRHKSSNLSE